MRREEARGEWQTPAMPDSALVPKEIQQPWCIGRAANEEVMAGVCCFAPWRRGEVAEREEDWMQGDNSRAFHICAWGQFDIAQQWLHILLGVHSSYWVLSHRETLAHVHKEKLIRMSIAASIKPSTNSPNNNSKQSKCPFSECMINCGIVTCQNTIQQWKMKVL